MKVNKICLLVLLAGLYASLGAGAEYQQVPVAIQISSSISDGDLALEEIVRIARNNGFQAVIMTDRDHLQWEYGLWPFRNLVKTRQSLASLATYGAGKYLEKIAALQQQYSDIIIIPGTEVAPFYYWEGSPQTYNFKLKNWHKHILVVGLNKANDYENLPAVVNKRSLRLPWGKEDLVLFWPFLLLVLGVICVRKRKYNYRDDRGHALGPYSSFWRALGFTLIFFSVLGVVNNYPYRRLKFDQYHGDQGIQPYQFLIDYANRQGALTYWAHPEAANISKRGDIKIETDYYADDLLRTQRYTGFAVFYDGFNKVGRIGGLWDTILKEYCAGQRNTPVWAIAAVAYDQGGNLDSRLQSLETVALVPNLNQAAILQALKSGRTYVIHGDRKLRLQEFSIRDTRTQSSAVAGEQVKVQGLPRLTIAGSGSSGPVKIQLIRNGINIKTFEVQAPFMINYIDQINKTGGKMYYRLEISNDKAVLVTNPIFVCFSE